MSEIDIKPKLLELVEQKAYSLSEFRKKIKAEVLSKIDQGNPDKDEFISKIKKNDPTYKLFQKLADSNSDYLTRLDCIDPGEISKDDINNFDELCGSVKDGKITFQDFLKQQPVLKIKPKIEFSEKRINYSKAIDDNAYFEELFRNGEKYSVDPTSEEFLNLVLDFRPDLILKYKDKFKDKKYADRYIALAKYSNPQDAFEKYKEYEKKDFANEILFRATVKDPQKAVKSFAHYSSSPFANEIFSKAVEIDPGKMTLYGAGTVVKEEDKAVGACKAYEEVIKSNKDLARKIITELSICRPHVIFENYTKIKRDFGEEVAKSVLRTAFQQACIKYPRLLLDKKKGEKENKNKELVERELVAGDKEKEEIKDAIDFAKDLKETALKHYKPGNILIKQVKLFEEMRDLNKYFTGDKDMVGALDEYNSRNKYGYQLYCMGINSGDKASHRPYEFILMNVNGSRKMCIGITLQELMDFDPKEKNIEKIKEKFVRLIAEKIEEQRIIFGQQIHIWDYATQHEYFDENSACILISADEDTDYNLVRMAEVFGHHKINANKVLVNSEKNWERFSEIEDLRKKEIIPKKVQLSSKENILTGIRSILKDAVDKGRTSCILYYVMHGMEDGKILCSDGKYISQEEIANILIAKYDGDKKELTEKSYCELLKLVIYQDSCKSNKQQGELVRFLDKANVSFDLTVISTSASDRDSATGSNNTNTQLISEKINSTPLTVFGFNFSYCVLEYVPYLEKLAQISGRKVEYPTGTMTDAAQFADMMSRWSLEKQDAVIKRVKKDLKPEINIIGSLLKEIASSLKVSA